MRLLRRASTCSAWARCERERWECEKKRKQQKQQACVTIALAHQPNVVLACKATYLELCHVCTLRPRVSPNLEARRAVTAAWLHAKMRCFNWSTNGHECQGFEPCALPRILPNFFGKDIQNTFQRVLGKKMVCRRYLGAISVVSEACVLGFWVFVFFSLLWFVAL